MLKKIYRLTDEGNRAIIKASLCMCLFNLATLLPVILFALITDEMLNRYFGYTAGGISLWIYWGIALIVLIVIFLAYKITYRKKYLTSGKEDSVLRMKLADKMRKLPLSYLGRRNLSDLTSVIMDDVAVAQNTLAIVATELIGGLLSGIIALAILFFYDWRLSLCLAACLPMAAAVMALCRVISEGTNKKNKQKKLDISDGLQEYLENIKVLQTSPNMETYQKTLESKIKRLIPGQILYELLSGITISISYNTMRLGLGLVIIVGSTRLISGQITTVTFLLFLFIAVRIYEPLTKACEMLGELIYSLVSAKRIRDLLDYPEQTGQQDIQLSQFDVTFDHVSFGYNQEDVIHNVSFTAKQGEITAIVGPSGCGKSTLCKLAARFWDVQRGSVSIGGVNVNKIDPEVLYKNYSFVFQDVVLFNDTIYNNIKIGKEDATRKQIMVAAKLARCDEFIERLPKGYDTVIGENGKTLSGGERQRLSIARAFLKDAPIILLDESTASIDPENETKIQEAIGKLIENKTVLIIAHKLRSIVDCDKIIVLKEGHLLESGIHEELMEEHGLYHRLYSLQNENIAWTVNSIS
ncbi:ABC transporter ATP-binding protein [Faecalicatena contorta]|uniref:ATP-binding cassette, subfamily B n=1 Tax=Faecalicatena contorta TaxID=39482 RepID=A0A315ZW10_9FIRM|nr:ABC transporter ATP-binding protein [Faecalicatena contorta]PWJ49413.1 ATP-binding cassette subfamily B protein [Faecalicatena contorta]SUQ14657.1 ATP-binding cassette, subfamily B [Faecalicatena contorta]